ncbi:MAG: lipocalin-like domain-containing protein [Hyphomicrobium sp.]
MIFPVYAQGFANLGADIEGFAIPKRGTPLIFPRDHGSHPDYKIEWWYFTANLRGDNGRDYGIQWTLFRSALAPIDKTGWSSSQLWMGHAAVTSNAEHFFAERQARGGIGQAGVLVKPYLAWIDNWELKDNSKLRADILSEISISASDIKFSYKLKCKSEKPIVLQGENGFSLKSPSGQASYYYSQPFYTVEGTLDISNDHIKVVGQGWFDREWSSQPLTKSQIGWDWFSIHFETGQKFMAYNLRDVGQDFLSGNWIEVDGKNEFLSNKMIEMRPLKWQKIKGKSLPIEWRIIVPSKGIDVETSPLNSQSWMSTVIPYWEGPISVQGSTKGVGYMELTGYK